MADISKIKLPSADGTEEVFDICDTVARESVKANSIDASDEGNSIRVDDCLGGVAFNSVEIVGKNLIPHSYTDSSKTHNGVVFVNNYPFITVKSGRTATASGPASFMITPSSGIKLANGTYVLSGCPKGGSFSTYSLCCGMKKIGQSAYAIGEYGNGTVITIDDTVEYVYFYVRIDASYTPTTDLVFEPQLELGSAATSYEPPIINREMTLDVSGKNLLGFPYAVKGNTVSNLTYTINADKTILLNTSAPVSEDIRSIYIELPQYLDAGTHTVSANDIDGIHTQIYLYDSPYTTLATSNGTKTFTVDKKTAVTVRINVSKGATFTNYSYKPQLELGSVATDYEPPVNTSYTFTPNSNSYTVPFDIIQNDGTNTLSIDGATLKVNAVKDNPTVKSIFESPDKLLTSNSKSGNPVVIENLQGGVPFNEVAVSGKNLVPYPYYSASGTSTDGKVTFTVNDDRSIHIVANNSATQQTFWVLDQFKKSNLPKNKYYFSLSDHNVDGVTMGFGKKKGSTWVSSSRYDIKGVGLDLDFSNYDIIVFNITVEIGAVFDETFYPQIELGSVATAYQQPITGREMQINVSGKNLMPYPYYNGTSYDSEKAHFEVDADGIITATRSETTGNVAAFSALHKYTGFKRGVSYFLSGSPVGGSGSTYSLYVAQRDSSDKAVEYNMDYGDGCAFTINDATAYIDVIAQLRNNYTTSADGIKFYPQIELGTVKTGFEPTKSVTSYSIIPDANPYTIPLDITQLDGTNVVAIDDTDAVVSVDGNKTNSQLAKIYKEFDRHTPQLLFSGVTSADSPAVVNLSGYEMIMICYGGNQTTSNYYNVGTVMLNVSEIDTIIDKSYIMATSVSTQPIVWTVGKSGNEYSFSCAGYSATQKIDNVKIYGINQHTELKIYSQPQDVTAVVGDRATFRVGVQGDGLTYQWQFSKNGGSTWGNTSNKTDTYTLAGGNLIAAISGYQYRCIITDKYGNTVTSEAAVLTVANILITNSPADVTAVIDETVSFSIEAKAATALSYQWQVKTTTGNWQNTIAAGNTTDTISCKATAPMNNWQYRCIITDANGNTITSNAATLTVTS